MSCKKKSHAQRTNPHPAATNTQPAESSAPETDTSSGKKKKQEVDPATINPQQFESGREVAAAIAKKYDLAIVGARLLSGSGENKGASVSLRMFETTMEYLFGKPSSHPHQEGTAPLQVIWDMPAPARELIEGDLP
jgi:hypothetical protein